MKKSLLFVALLVISLQYAYSQIELVTNGTFEEPLSEFDGFGYYSGSATATTIDQMRVDSVAYEGTHSVRIFDHTWGTFLWKTVPGFTDNHEYVVSFWYKGAEPMNFSLYIGRDLNYDLGADPDNIVPGNAVVADDQGVVNAKLVWYLEAKTDWTLFTYTFKMTDWLGVDPQSGEPISNACTFILSNTSYMMDDGNVSYVDNASITKRDLAEIMKNGSFEGPLTYGDGYGFYSGSPTIILLDDFRVDSVAYDGTHSVRIFDHLWGTFLWDQITGFQDSTRYEVSFWYKGEEPLKFSMFLGRDLGYDLGADPDHIVPADVVLMDDQGIANARMVWSLAAQPEWTEFTYSFNISNWLGNDPGTGEPLIGQCIIMFENSSYMMDDGANSYVDKVSVLKKPSTLSVAENTPNSHISVRPNPATNLINLDGIEPGTIITIYHFSGMKVKECVYQQRPIDVSSLGSGAYMIQGYSTKGEKYTGKFLIH